MYYVVMGPQIIRRLQVHLIKAPKWQIALIKLVRAGGAEQLSSKLQHTYIIK